MNSLEIPLRFDPDTGADISPPGDIYERMSSVDLSTWTFIVHYKAFGMTFQRYHHPDYDRPFICEVTENVRDGPIFIHEHESLKNRRPYPSETLLDDVKRWYKDDDPIPTNLKYFLTAMGDKTLVDADLKYRVREKCACKLWDHLVHLPDDGWVVPEYFDAARDA